MITLYGAVVLVGFAGLILYFVSEYCTYRAWKRGEDLSQLDRFFYGPPPGSPALGVNPAGTDDGHPVENVRITRPDLACSTPSTASLHSSDVHPAPPAGLASGAGRAKRVRTP